MLLQWDVSPVPRGDAAESVFGPLWAGRCRCRWRSAAPVSLSGPEPEREPTHWRPGPLILWYLYPPVAFSSVCIQIWTEHLGPSLYVHVRMVLRPLSGFLAADLCFIVSNWTCFCLLNCVRSKDMYGAHAGRTNRTLGLGRTLKNWRSLLYERWNILHSTALIITVTWTIQNLHQHVNYNKNPPNTHCQRASVHVGRGIVGAVTASFKRLDFYF